MAQRVVRPNGGARCPCAMRWMELDLSFWLPYAICVCAMCVSSRRVTVPRTLKDAHMREKWTPIALAGAAHTLTYICSSNLNILYIFAKFHHIWSRKYMCFSQTRTGSRVVAKCEAGCMCDDKYILHQTLASTSNFLFANWYSTFI